MRSSIKKWGNSLALRIPRSIAEDSRIREGAEVDLTVRQGHLIVTPVRGAKPTLAALLADVTESNLHSEVASGGAVGREAW